MNTRWIITPELFDRYCAGQCTANERRKIDAFLDTNTNAREAIERLVASLGTNATAPDVDAMWMEARARIDAGGSADYASRAPRHHFMYPFFAAMCAIAIVVMGTILSSYRDTSLTVVTYSTSNAQRGTVHLPDGSSVTLSATTSLEVPESYNSDTRSLNLNGRALFTVLHGAKNPFIVHTDNVTTRVLGTVFMISNYSSDQTTEIAVRQGRVAANDVVVSASEMVSIDSSGKSKLQSVTNAPFLFANGILAIDSTPLSQAIPELNRWYDVDIRLSDPALGSRLIEGKFPEGNKDDLLEVLEWMFHARVVAKGKTITLFPLTEN